MDSKALRNQTPKQLNDLLAKTAAQVRDLRFTVMTRQQARVRDLRKARRELARIKTVIKEKGNQSSTAKATDDKETKK
jgi:large subunit ribosomal protein L29